MVLADSRVPLLEYEELLRARRGALLAAIHSLLARPEGLVGQAELRAYGGRLPSHTDRNKWRYIVNEFQARCLLIADHPLYDNHYFYVPLMDGLKMFAVA